MPLFYNPCLRERKRQEDEVKQGVHWWCPQKISMLFNRPPSRQTGWLLHLINNNSFSVDEWYLTRSSSLKVCSLPQWWMFKEIRQVFSNIWDIHWMTFNPDSSQEPKVATAKSLSRPQKVHGQLSGAFHTTQASTGRVQSGANSP